MAPSFILNPLTSGRIVRDGAEPVALELRCFARRRSLRHIRIERSVAPRLFDELLAWLEGGECTVPHGLELDQQLALWRNGLLIAPAELEGVPPGARPEIGDGQALAKALFPAVAHMLDAEPELASLAANPDQNLSARGFCELPPVISATDIEAMSGFYGVLLKHQFLELDKKQGKRFFCHNDPVARHIQLALNPLFSAIYGQQLKPSYTFFSTYFDQSPLPRHTDREQCELTFSLYLDYSPQPADEFCPWPLVVHPPEGDVLNFQRKGGGCLLRGRHLPHSRPPLPPGHEARMLFCHYVLDSFDGPLD